MFCSWDEHRALAAMLVMTAAFAAVSAAPASAGAVATSALTVGERSELVGDDAESATTTQAGEREGEARDLAQLRRVSREIVKQAVRLRPETAGWHWRVKFYRDPLVDVRALAGGEIMVTAGVFERLRPSDDELAQLVAHELAYVLGPSRGRAAVPETISAPARDLSRGDGGRRIARSASSGAQREAAENAERLGLELAARAGFDPRAALAVGEKVRALAPGERDTIRPVDAGRLRAIERVLPEMLRLWRSTQRTMFA